MLHLTRAEWRLLVVTLAVGLTVFGVFLWSIGR